MGNSETNTPLARAQRPQPAGKIVWSALALYWRYPFLFLALGALVIVPYEAAVLAATGNAFYQGDPDGMTRTLIHVADVVWVTPVISALHIHAVAAIRCGDKPRVRPVAAAGFSSLRFVFPATVVSGLLIELTFAPGKASPMLGFLALIGVLLGLRWFVVAQAGSIERLPWLRPLGRSAELTREHWGHVIAFFVLTALVIAPPVVGVSLALHGHPTTPGSFLGGLSIHTVGASLLALASALLYYDLRLRDETESPMAQAAPEPA